MKQYMQYILKNKCSKIVFVVMQRKDHFCFPKEPFQKKKKKKKNIYIYIYRERVKNILIISGTFQERFFMEPSMAIKNIYF